MWALRIICALVPGALRMVIAAAITAGLPSIVLGVSIDVNRATQVELEAISGIGPAMSGRIIEERSRAPFRSYQDLRERVRGIGEVTLRRLRAGGLTVGGGLAIGHGSAQGSVQGVETIVGGGGPEPVRKRRPASRRSRISEQPAGKRQRPAARASTGKQASAGTSSGKRTSASGRASTSRRAPPSVQ